MSKYEPSYTSRTVGNMKKQELPAYSCASCSKCENSRCSYFERPIVENYHRCFKHSFYSSIFTKFKAPNNLEEIIEKENIYAA